MEPIRGGRVLMAKVRRRSWAVMTDMGRHGHTEQACPMISRAPTIDEVVGYDQDEASERRSRLTGGKEEEEKGDLQGRCIRRMGCGWKLNLLHHSSCHY
jgi:hypothetical protein